MTLEISQLQESLETGQDEFVDIVRRAFEVEISSPTVAESANDDDSRNARLAGPGLIVAAQSNEDTYLFLFAADMQVLQLGYRSTNPSRQNCLMVFAQEIGMTLLPEAIEADDFKSMAVAQLDEAMTASGVADDATWTEYTVEIEGKPEAFYLVHPCPNVDAIIDLNRSEDAPAGGSEDHSDDAERQVPISESFQRQDLPDEMDAAIAHLPRYTKSLLRISVPVSVKLASSPTPVRQIVDLSTGTLLQFDKNCEEALVLEVAGHEIASGEAVKVGDKFGLRINSILLPPERFGSIRSDAAPS